MQTDIKYTITEIDWKTGKTLSVSLAKPKLKEGAVPCILPNCPTYLSKSKSEQVRRLPPCEKRTILEAEALKTAIAESTITAETHRKKYNFQTFEELIDKLKYISVGENWSSIIKKDVIVFLYLDMEILPHYILYVIINRQLQVKVCLRGIEIESKDIQSSVCNLNQLEYIFETSEQLIKGDAENVVVIDIIQNLLDTLLNKNEENKMINFVKTQLQLYTKSKQCYRYDSDLMILSSLLMSISPHAYKFLRKSGIVILPHPNTIKNLSSAVNVNPNSVNFLSYIKEKYTFLKPEDHTVILMLDEIHIKPYFDYKGGNIVGMAYNSDDVATTAHVFMIQSILTQFKDVVHILPVSKINAGDLFNVVKSVVVGLENVGFRVISIITDNNSINRKAISNFASPSQVSIVYPNPINPSRPLFFLNDSVHIFKCIRNNWLNLKNEGLTFCYPDFENFDIIRYASFDAVRKTYNSECHKLLKIGYGLTAKALWPSTIERQNVKLVAQVFSETTEQSLIELGPTQQIRNWKDTAEFIKIIRTWWYVVNVKTPLKGVHLRQEMQQPLTNDSNDVRYRFLNKFLCWLDKWEMIDLNGKLTKETHLALKLTTYGLVQLVEYCMKELKFQYILPGKFQTDALENRFGLYRQLSGSQYHISLRQIFESEKKLRLQNSLHLSLKNGSEEKINITTLDSADDETTDMISTHISVSDHFINITANLKDLNSLDDDLPVLTYIAGYCCHSVVKRIKCEACAGFLIIDKQMAADLSNRLIIRMDRGGLKFPSKPPLLVVMNSFAILRRLLEEEDFLKLENQRLVASKLILDHVQSVDDFMLENSCPVHSTIELWRKIICIVVNIILNNYCKLKNNAVTSSILEKKSNKRNRKLLTVSNKPTNSNKVKRIK